jgi:hypothetical protein
MTLPLRRMGMPDDWPAYLPECAYPITVHWMDLVMNIMTAYICYVPYLGEYTLQGV